MSIDKTHFPSFSHGNGGYNFLIGEADPGVYRAAQKAGAPCGFILSIDVMKSGTGDVIGRYQRNWDSFSIIDVSNFIILFLAASSTRSSYLVSGEDIEGEFKINPNRLMGYLRGSHKTIISSFSPKSVRLENSVLPKTVFYAELESLCKRPREDLLSLAASALSRVNPSMTRHGMPHFLDVEVKLDQRRNSTRLVIGATFVCGNFLAYWDKDIVVNYDKGDVETVFNACFDDFVYSLCCTIVAFAASDSNRPNRIFIRPIEGSPKNNLAQILQWFYQAYDRLGDSCALACKESISQSLLRQESITRTALPWVTQENLPKLESLSILKANDGPFAPIFDIRANYCYPVGTSVTKTIRLQSEKAFSALWMEQEEALSFLERLWMEELPVAAAETVGELEPAIRLVTEEDNMLLSQLADTVSKGPIEVRFPVGLKPPYQFAVYKQTEEGAFSEYLVRGSMLEYLPFPAGLYSNIARTPYSFEDSAPKTIYDLVFYFQQAKNLYLSMDKGSLKIYPKVSITVSSGYVFREYYLDRYGDKQRYYEYSDEAPSASPKEYLTGFFEKTIKEALIKASAVEERSLFLKDMKLNRAELSLLRFIAACRRRPTITDITQQFVCDDVPKSKYEALLRSLSLHNTLIEVNESNRYGYYVSYKVKPDITKQVLEAQTPAPYSKFDLELLSASIREKVVLEMLYNAYDADARWQTLQLASQYCSKAALADFAKSEAGNSFFSSMEGDDAVYAKFLIESLPGCKRLALSLFETASP